MHSSKSTCVWRCGPVVQHRGVTADLPRPHVQMLAQCARFRNPLQLADYRWHKAPSCTSTALPTCQFEIRFSHRQKLFLSRVRCQELSLVCLLQTRMRAFCCRPLNATGIATIKRLPPMSCDLGAAAAKQPCSFRRCLAEFGCARAQINFF